jgi:putative oxidoreductase
MIMKDILDLLARIFLSSIFLFEAWDSIYYFEETKHTMSLYGLTWQQNLLLSAGIVILIVGGLLVLFGYYSNFGALLLLSYYLPVTLIVFSFWNDPPDVVRIQSLNFMRNIGVCGGLMLLMVHKSGRYSVKRLIYRMKLPS